MLAPKVSVIMPVYNGAKFLEESIGSLFAQTFADFEIIAVDDGSTDSSLEVLSGLRRQDGRLQIHSRSNSGGPAVPKNDGIGIAKGEYIGFLDYDDYCHPEHLHELVVGLDANQKWIAAFHDIEVVDVFGKPRPQTYLQEIEFRNKASHYLVGLGEAWFECAADFHDFMLFHHAAMHTQSVLIARKRLNGATLSFDARYRIGEDTDLWLRLGYLSRLGRLGRIGFLDRVLGSYRMHLANITKDKLESAEGVVMVYVNHYREISGSADEGMLSRLREKISYKHGRLAYELYALGKHRLARAHFTEAMKWFPNRSYGVDRFKTYLPAAVSGWLRRVRAS